MLAYCSFAIAHSQYLALFFLIAQLKNLSLLRAKFTLLKNRGELVENIVRRHVTVQLEFVAHVHSYIERYKFCLMLITVCSRLCSLPNQQRFLMQL